MADITLNRTWNITRSSPESGPFRAASYLLLAAHKPALTVLNNSLKSGFVRDIRFALGKGRRNPLSIGSVEPVEVKVLWVTYVYECGRFLTKMIINRLVHFSKFIPQYYY